jgi:hypothetical protein
MLASLVACTGSPTVHVNRAPSAAAPVTAAIGSSTESDIPSPTSTLAVQTVPADVPTTGPNMRRGEKPPVMPQSATGHTGAGAQAFAVFFVRTIDWGFATLSGAYIRHVSGGGCVGCRSFADGMDRDRRLGHQYIGGRLTVRHGRLLRYRESSATVAVRFDQTSYEEVDRTRRFVSADGAHTGERLAVDVQWLHSGWRVVEIQVLL